MQKFQFKYTCYHLEEREAREIYIAIREIDFSSSKEVYGKDVDRPADPKKIQGKRVPLPQENA